MAILLLITLAFAGSALAQCQPGQLQEANLAYGSAVEFLNNKQWDQAIARMQSIVDVCPEHVEATRGIGTALVGKGDYQNATTWFKKVVQLRGNEVQAGDFGNLASSFAKLKMYKEARAEYMKAQKIAPDDCGVLFNLGVMHYASGFHPQSVEVLEHALEVCPQYRDPILVQLSKSAAKASEQQKKNGNNEKAAYYATLVNTYGGQAGGSTTYDMVKVSMQKKNYPEAVNLLKQMLAKNPNQPNAVLTLARAQDAMGNKAGSVEAYRTYLALKPNDAEATGTMLQVMVEAGQCSRAATEANMAAQRLQAKGRSALASVYYSWGLALECQKDYEQARSKFARCVGSGNEKYSSPGQEQVERMEGFIALAEAEKKKARQRG
jgi:tetratricopeptide (TPR) repeat protein